MRVWIIQDGEPLPGIDPGVRDWRCTMLAKALAASGHRVFWWASRFDHASKKNRTGHPAIVEINSNLQIRLLDGPGYVKNRSLQRFYHHRALAHAFAKEAAGATPPDVIFSSLPTLELAEKAVGYGRSHDVPVLVDVRDLWPDHYLTLVPKSLRGVGRLALTKEFRRARKTLSGATGITSISKSFLSWALEIASTSQRETDSVFPMSYPAQVFSAAEIEARTSELRVQYDFSRDQLNIVFIGAVNSIFDFTTVLNAARILAEREPSVRFVFVGDGTDYEVVRAQAAGLPNVVFTGRMDHGSVTALMHLGSSGLAPYAEGPSITGSLPNKAFEYMFAGLPLLSSHQGDLAELIAREGIGLQYEPRNSTSLLDKVHWLIHHPVERATMGSRARLLFEREFSSDVVYSRFVGHIERVVNSYRDQ